MAIVAPAAPSTPSAIAARSSARTPMPSAMPMSSVTTWRSANVLRSNSTSRLSAACHAIISSMWSKNAMPDASFGSSRGPRQTRSGDLRLARHAAHDGAPIGDLDGHPTVVIGREHRVPPGSGRAVSEEATVSVTRPGPGRQPATTEMAMTDASPVRFSEGEMLPGRLELPHSINTGGWSNLVIPIATVANGDGADGAAAGRQPRRRARVRADPDGPHLLAGPVRGTGRLIIVPRLSIEASNADRRLWPDGTNLNRVFPGSATGTHPGADGPSPVDRAVPHVGRGDGSPQRRPGTRFVPMAHMRLVQDRAQRRAMLEAMLAFNTDLHMLYSDVTGVGLLVAEAERQGKLVVSTELGGGGMVRKESIGVGRRGLLNCLRHLGALSGPGGDARVAGVAAGRARVRPGGAPLRPRADLRHV